LIWNKKIAFYEEKEDERILFFLGTLKPCPGWNLGYVPKMFIQTPPIPRPLIVGIPLQWEGYEAYKRGS
jgi:hypothetical protein